MAQVQAGRGWLSFVVSCGRMDIRRRVVCRNRYFVCSFLLGHRNIPKIMEAKNGNGHKEYHSPQEAALHLTVSYWTVLRMIKRQQIAVIAVGDRYLIPQSEIERIMTPRLLTPAQTFRLVRKHA